MDQMQQFQSLSGGFTLSDLSIMEMGVYSALILTAVIALFTIIAVGTLPIFFSALFVLKLGFTALSNFPDPIGKYSKLAELVFRSIGRNLLRTTLTYIALFVLTGILTALYGIVNKVNDFLTEQEGDQVVIMSERFSVPSRMPPRHKDALKDVMQDTFPERYPNRNAVSQDVMSWSFVIGSLDQTKFTKDDALFLFALDPSGVRNEMMGFQGLKKEDLGEEKWNDLMLVLDQVERNKMNIIVGEDKLKKLKKQVGDSVRMYCLNYPDLIFDFKIVGMFPSSSRLADVSAMRYDYLLSTLEQYEKDNGTPHAMADQCANLVLARLPNKAAYEKLASKVNESGKINNPAVKIETFSSLMGAFLEPFKDIFWGLKWIIMPGIAITMCLVISITITIGVRERRTELAVMKVLGFQPWQLMCMVVGEAVLIGLFGGMLSTWGVYFLPKIIRAVLDAINTQIDFFDTFTSPTEIILYGPLLGIMVGIIGSALPSWNARKVKVSEVFAQVA